MTYKVQSTVTVFPTNIVFQTILVIRSCNVHNACWHNRGTIYR